MLEDTVFGTSEEDEFGGASDENPADLNGYFAISPDQGAMASTGASISICVDTSAHVRRKKELLESSRLSRSIQQPSRSQCSLREPLSFSCSP
jgi:hypothetical protein